MSERDRRQAAIIGPGRVGQTIALLLNHCGYHLKTIIASNRAKARSLSRRWSASVIALTDQFNPPPLLFITTRDDQIGEVATKLAARQLDWRNTTLFHCSGAHSSTLLSPLSEAGAAVGSLHPLKSFAAPIKQISELQGIYWCVEGDPRARRLAQRLVRASGGRSVSIDSAMKPIYHAAAVMSCGHLVALIDLSLAMLGECGIARADALKMLMPLVDSTVRNLANQGSEAALTGPFARGDIKTIGMHLQALLSLNRDYSTIYTLLGEHSLKMKRSSKQTPTTE